ncbi:MAG: histone deacetylase [Clostridia bacterium]|nr:histone deacetylase [Clostridia bacterium]MDD4047292.1 histone deacetylase [Clostridia bacterium]
MTKRISSKTGLVFFPAFDWAISPTHPEREERLLYTRDQIFEEGILDNSKIREYKTRLAEEKDIQRVHFCVPDISAQTTMAHFISAGSTLKLADAFMAGEIKNGFAIVRPPGHHAMRVVHGNRGFCNINNEAILVEYLRKKYGFRKIAIVDTDVHHGDGTQNIFYHDPDVLFISLHQDGRTLYPGTGFTDEAGGPGAYLKNINIPLLPGTGDEGLFKVWEEIIKPVLSEFKPELIINSAGQDNHFTDPLANMLVTAQGYAKLTEELKPDLAVLEGGYAIETALPYVNLGILLALAGEDYSWVKEPQKQSKVLKQSADVNKYVDKIVKYWYKELSQKPPSKEELYGSTGIYSDERYIYYDTDSINEKQHELAYFCPDCPGIYQVLSQSNKSYGQNYKIDGITIPIFACPVCQKKAYDLWETEKEKGKSDIYYLQDKVKDSYLTVGYCSKKTK